MVRGSGLHHIHKRKRIHRKHEPYPHPKKWIRWLDKIVLFIAIVGPIANIPQIMKIYIEGNISGLSLPTWISYLVMAIPWLVYGFVHREKPIIVTYILWGITNLIIVIGIIIYSV
jgi:uncharacterized protein with PQ loop repeat